MLDEFKKSVPMHLLTMKESYKTMRKSESDLFATKLTNSSLNSYLTYRNNGTSLSTGNLSTVNNLIKQNKTEDLHVLLISSKVPCSYVIKK